MKKKLSTTVLAICLGLASSYVYSKPMIGECEVHCTAFCQFLGFCKG